MSNSQDDISSSLCNAVSNGNLAQVKELVRSHGLDYCKGWYGGYVLLRNAIKFFHFNVAAFLLQEGAKVDCNTSYVSTPLHFATERNCVDIVRLLLEKNASIEARNGQNETPLHIAARDGYTEIVEALLDNNASLTAKTSDGFTPLLLAAELKHEKIVQMILQHALADRKDKTGDVSSNSSAEKGNSSFLNRILLCNPSAIGKINELVVRIVTQDKGKSKIVDNLVDYGFILMPAYANKTLLRAATEKGYLKLIDSILTKGSHPNAAEYLTSLLHTAVKKGCQEMIKLYINSGFDVNGKDHVGKTPLCYSLDRIKVMQLLLTHGADPNLAPEVLHSAVSEGSIKVCKVLIKNHANVNALNAQGDTPLHLAIPKKERGYALWLKKKDKEKIDISTRNKILSLLLVSGADVSIKSADGFTAFHKAAFIGWVETVNIFLKYGVDADLRAEDGSTSLYIAAQKGHEEIVEILCKNGANVNACQKNGWTPLHTATTGQYAEIVKTLLKFGADIDARSHDNATALHCTLFDRHESVVQILLDHGCDINVETDCGNTALDYVVSELKTEFFTKPRYQVLQDFLNSSDSDDYISDFEDFYPDENKTVLSLRKHLIKLKTAGLYVSKKNLDELDKSDIDNYFWDECKEEVVRMKNEKLNPQFSLFNVLTNSKNPTYARNESLMRILKKFNFAKFPIYESLIRNKFGNSKSRLALISLGAKWLDVLRKTSDKLKENKFSVLPVEISEKIVMYLDNYDVKNLISCGETLKRQLQQ